MMMLLRELQDLQMHISNSLHEISLNSNSLHEISLNVDFNIFKDSVMINCYTCLFPNINEKGKSVYLYSFKSYEENRKHLNYFVKHVKKLAKYGSEKSEPNQTPT